MKVILLCLSLLTLFSCAKGPDQNELRKTIQHKLETNFAPDLFTIVDFSRRGSYKYSDIKTGKQGLILYFKAKLKLNRDYKFTDWDSLSAGSLTYLLGATASGIEGIKSAGNKAGDIITVYGTSNYIRQENNWIASTAINSNQHNSKNNKKQKFVSEIDASKKYEQKIPEYKNSLKILNQIFATMNNERDKNTLRLTQKELNELLEKAQMHRALKAGITTFATGPKSGNYFSLAKALSNLGQQKIEVFSTSGSVENCKLVSRGKVKFAIVQSNVAAMAYYGKEAFKDNVPMQDLRAVAALFPEAVMIVTKQTNKIKHFNDLKNRTISIGEIGSGSHSDAMNLLRAAKLKPSDFRQILELSLDESITALKQGLIDAFFVTAAYPMNALAELNQTEPIRLISLPNLLREKMVAEHALIKIKIPRKTYVGQEQDIYTVGATALLITNKNSSDKLVNNILQEFLHNSEALSKENIYANYITKRSIKRGITIPLHSAVK